MQVPGDEAILFLELLLTNTLLPMLKCPYINEAFTSNFSDSDHFLNRL